MRLHPSAISISACGRCIAANRSSEGSRRWATGLLLEYAIACLLSRPSNLAPGTRAEQIVSRRNDHDCNRPHNLDEAVARRGASQCKRKDSCRPPTSSRSASPRSAAATSEGRRSSPGWCSRPTRRSTPKGRVRAFEAVPLSPKRKGDGSLDELGLVLRSSTPLLGEAGNPWGYNSFKKRWDAFVGKAGFSGTRPYALRHTFATVNLARGENVKTASVLLGHADASYTLDLHVGFIPATTRGLANRYVGGLVPRLVDGEEARRGGE